VTLKEIMGLSHGNWVVLRDGREGRFQEVHEYHRKDNEPFVIVNLPNKDDPYSHNEWLWPAQIKRRR